MLKYLGLSASFDLSSSNSTFIVNSVWESLQSWLPFDPALLLLATEAANGSSLSLFLALSAPTFQTNKTNLKVKQPLSQKEDHFLDDMEIYSCLSGEGKIKTIKLHM